MLPLQDSSGLHPAPCVRPASSSPFPGPQPRTQALQTGEGHTPQLGPVFLSLGCSIAFWPSQPRLAGHRWAGAWVSLCSSLSQPQAWYQSWDACPTAESGSSQSHPCAQPLEAEETLGMSAEPSCPWGWRHAARAPQEGCAGWVAQTTLCPVLVLCSGRACR